MKKTLLIALSGLMLTGAMSSCKKGENDPFMSLSSRKARVAGEWTVSKMESMDKTTNVGDGSSVTFTTTYDGGTATTTQTLANSGGSVSNSTSSEYTVKYNIEKDGTWTATWTMDGETMTDSGTWLFLGKNKEAELKNKEAIMFITASSQDANGTDNSEGLQNNVIYVIDQLKGKEMVLKQTSTDTNEDTKFESSSTITLTQ